MDNIDQLTKRASRIIDEWMKVHELYLQDVPRASLAILVRELLLEKTSEAYGAASQAATPSPPPSEAIAKANARIVELEAVLAAIARMSNYWRPERRDNFDDHIERIMGRP